MIPVATEATVTACETLGAYRVLTFRAPQVASGARPGQFVNIASEHAFLRRPFSVYMLDRALGTVSVAFDAIGDGTRWLGARAPGDALDIVGPLGHGFEVPEPDGGADLIVGGGYGSAALAFLADELAQRGREVVALLGARTAARLFIDDTLRGSCNSIHTTTDDGSEGHPGIVTDLLADIVRSRNITTIYACGPMRMLEAVAAAAPVRAQLAVEEFMACGLGVCWTCVLPVRVGNDVKHLRACTEGPVFAAEAVAWA